MKINNNVKIEVSKCNKCNGKIGMNVINLYDKVRWYNEDIDKYIVGKELCYNCFIELISKFIK